MEKELWVPLFQLADEYWGMNGLINRLSSANVVERIVLADAHSSQKLMQVGG